MHGVTMKFNQTVLFSRRLLCLAVVYFEIFPSLKQTGLWRGNSNYYINSYPNPPFQNYLLHFRVAYLLHFMRMRQTATVHVYPNVYLVCDTSVDSS